MVTTVDNKPIISKKPSFTQEERLVYKERCKQVRVKAANRKGLMVRFLQVEMKTNAIKDYTDLRNIVSGLVYRPDILDQYEAFVDQILEKENQKNHEPII